MEQVAPERVASVLERISSSRSLLGKFLNTLSMLEYVGTRKILKSQRADSITKTILTHIVEESRHALLLKQLAAETSPDPIPTYEERYVLAGKDAVAYFQGLDRAIEENIASPLLAVVDRAEVLNYLYTTYLIELRAESFYPMMGKIACGGDNKGVFDRILREEEGHMSSVLEYAKRIDPSHAERLPPLIAIEGRLFGDFISALEQAIA